MLYIYIYIYIYVCIYVYMYIYIYIYIYIYLESRKQVMCPLDYDQSANGLMVIHAHDVWLDTAGTSEPKCVQQVKYGT